MNLHTAKIRFKTSTLPLEMYWCLGRGAVIAAWGFRDDLERCVAELAPHLGGDEGYATRLAQTYRAMAIGAPRRLGENAELPPLPEDWDFDAEEPADALPTEEPGEVFTDLPTDDDVVVDEPRRRR